MQQPCLFATVFVTHNGGAFSGSLTMSTNQRGTAQSSKTSVLQREARKWSIDIVSHSSSAQRLLPHGTRTRRLPRTISGACPNTPRTTAAASVEA